VSGPVVKKMGKTYKSNHAMTSKPNIIVKLNPLGTGNAAWIGAKVVTANAANILKPVHTWKNLPYGRM